MATKAKQNSGPIKPCGFTITVPSPLWDDLISTWTLMWGGCWGLCVTTQVHVGAGRERGRDNLSMPLPLNSFFLREEQFILALNLRVQAIMTWKAWKSFWLPKQVTRTPHISHLYFLSQLASIWNNCKEVFAISIKNWYNFNIYKLIFFLSY